MQFPAPVASASMVVDPDCPRRMARSATLNTTRLFLVFMIGVLPGVVVGSVFDDRSGSSGESNPAVAVAVGAGVVVLVLILITAIVFGVVLPQITRLYTLTMPPGSQLRVDWFPDRMVVTSAGGIVRETLYATINRVRVRPHVVVLDRGRGAGVLPIEVVPPPAIDLLRRGTGGGVTIS